MSSRGIVTVTCRSQVLRFSNLDVELQRLLLFLLFLAGFFVGKLLGFQSVVVQIVFFGVSHDRAVTSGMLPYDAAKKSG